MELFLPKIIISDLSLPAGCFSSTAGPVKLSFVTINFNLISFAPLGIPFRIDTEMNGQPLSLYLVQGINQRMIRLKDQAITLSRLAPLMGGQLKLAGNITIDLSVLMTNSNHIKGLELKAQSKDFQLPPQNIQGFSTPIMKVNDFYLEANAENPPQVSITKMIVGDPDSPMRANFKGRIDLQPGYTLFSPLNLTGEIAFAEALKKTVPLVDLLFQNFTQKDGFYQIRLGGTLGQPRLINQ
jgi:hypothetical protein